MNKRAKSPKSRKAGGTNTRTRTRAHTRASLSDNSSSRVVDVTTEKQIKQTILLRIVEGESLRSICRAADMPGRTTVFRWLTQDEQFRLEYGIAVKIRAHDLAHEIIEIADTPEIGVKTITKADGSVEHVCGDMVEHRKLRVDTRKWLASKLAPRVFGDSTLLKHGDPDGRPLREMDETEKVMRIASLLEKYRRGRSER